MKNGSANEEMSDASGRSKTINAVRCPSKVVKCIASGFQRCAARCMTVPRLPSLIARFPDSTGKVILAMTRMSNPPDDLKLSAQRNRWLTLRSVAAPPRAPCTQRRGGDHGEGEAAQREHCRVVTVPVEAAHDV